MFSCALFQRNISCSYRAQVATARLFRTYMNGGQFGGWILGWACFSSSSAVKSLQIRDLTFAVSHARKSPWRRRLWIGYDLCTSWSIRTGYISRFEKLVTRSWKRSSRVLVNRHKKVKTSAMCYRTKQYVWWQEPSFCSSKYDFRSCDAEGVRTYIKHSMIKLRNATPATH